MEVSLYLYCYCEVSHSQSKSGTIFSLSPDSVTWNSAKAGFESSGQNKKKEIEMNLCQGFVSCGSLFRTLCRWAGGSGGGGGGGGGRRYGSVFSENFFKTNAQVPKSVVRKKEEKSVFCLLLIIFTQGR